MSKIRASRKMCVEMHCDSLSYVKISFYARNLMNLVVLAFWRCAKQSSLGEGRERERKESREVYTEGLLCQICSYGAFIPIGKTVFKFSRFVFLYLKTIISFAPFYPFLFKLGNSVASRVGTSRWNFRFARDSRAFRNVSLQPQDTPLYPMALYIFDCFQFFDDGMLLSL